MNDWLKLNKDNSYSPIVYYDTYLSVDPIIGCQLNCQYCFLQINKWAGIKKPQRLYAISQIIDMLLNHKYFIPNKTVLCFGNQTDPFLPINIAQTIEFISALESYKLTNPLVLATKKLIPTDFLHKVSNLKYLKPIFFLSYSGLPSEVEKGVNPEENQINFKNLKKYHLPTVHFWRPLTNINGTSEVIKNLLEFVTQYALASVCLGLRLNPKLNLIYDHNKYLKIPEELLNQYGEYIPADVEKRLRNLAKQNYPNYPLYKHTSCAVSLVLSSADYNATIYNDFICNKSTCPPWKRNICEYSRSVPKKENVINSLRKIGRDCNFSFIKNAIELNGEITQEDYVFLLHQLNYPIIAKKLKHNLLLRGTIINYQSESKKEI